jgi:hypothetical protein
VPFTSDRVKRECNITISITPSCPYTSQNMPQKNCKEVEVEEKDGGRKNTHHAIIDLFARTARSVGRRHLRPLHSLVRLILPHGCLISLHNCPPNPNSARAFQILPQPVLLLSAPSSFILRYAISNRNPNQGPRPYTQILDKKINKKTHSTGRLLFF